MDVLIITGVQASGAIIDRLLQQCCFVWSEIVCVDLWMYVCLHPSFCVVVACPRIHVYSKSCSIFIYLVQFIAYNNIIIKGREIQKSRDEMQ